jgi:hypothetical protein
MKTKRNDATGHKRGAGPYSDSNAAGVTEHGQLTTPRNLAPRLERMAKRNTGGSALVRDTDKDGD